MQKVKYLLSRFFLFCRTYFLPITTFFILLGCYGILEVSCIIDMDAFGEYIYLYNIRYLFLNLLTVSVFWTFFLLVSRHIWTADLLCTLFCSCVAIANHYVISFHGMPLSFLLVKNFTTAMNVISGYSFTIGVHVCILIIGALLLLTLCYFVYQHEKTRVFSSRQKFIRDFILLSTSACVLFFGYFGPNPVKPPQTITWLWSEAYSTYGYLPCSIETLCQLFQTVTIPDGYSEEQVQQITIDSTAQAESVTPDILLILNESFYDPAQIVSVKTDVPYLDEITNLENLLFGYAVCPNAGGGTNVTEYELLTSNSSFLMPGVTPFNLLDLRNANSIVTVLSELGYSTQASHPAPPTNYSRGFGYRALGFQQSYFLEDFNNLEYFGNRPYETDASVFDNLIHWYEQADPDHPRFLYTLTLQNHGSWDMNTPEQNRIRLSSDFGSLTQPMEEFLSCLSLSGEAFADLTEYFSQSNRPVIICMVGDHSPAFATTIVDAQYSADEAALRVRKVPLFIWANFPLPNEDLGTMSMNYVIPTLLDIAGVRLSPYYRYMLQLKEQVPILTSYGSYYDRDGNLFKYSDSNSPYKAAVNNYFYLEYHNLQPDRDQTLFRPGN